MTDHPNDQPSVADLTQAQISLVALARHVSDSGIDIGAVRILLADLDPVLCVVVAARLLRNCCTELAGLVGCSVDELFDGIVRVAVDQAADAS